MCLSTAGRARAYGRPTARSSGSRPRSAAPSASIDAAKREIVKRRSTFAVPGVPNEAIQPVGIAITRDRKLAFVALGPANRVAVVDAQSYEVLKYLLVGQRVWSLAFNPAEPGLHDERRQQRHLGDRCRIARR